MAIRTRLPPKPSAAIGRPARLSLELIAETALEMVGQSSLDQLSMRALAERLHATPMALYKHVEGRDELNRLVVERSFAALELPPMSLQTLSWLEHLARAVRAIGISYPGVMDYLLEHGPVVHTTLLILDRTVSKLHDAGLTWKEAGEVHNTFFSWLAGSVRREQRVQSGQPAPFSGFLEAARALPEEDFPGLARSLRYMEKLDFESEFTVSLHLLLDAVRLRISRRVARTRRRS